MFKHTAIPFVALFAGVFGAGGAGADVIASWSFNETTGSIAADAVGAADGTLMGDATFVGGGIFGNSLSMSRNGGGFAQMGDHFGFAGGTTFSLQVWVKTTTSLGAVVMGRHVSGFQNGYMLALNDIGDGGVSEPVGSFKLYQSDANALNSGPANINNGEWHQLVGVHDGASNQIRIYLDGSRSPTPGAFDGFHNIGVNTASFALGAIVSGGVLSSTYDGLLDEARLFDHALTDDEVRFLYEHPGALPEPSCLSLALLAFAIAPTRRR